MKGYETLLPLYKKHHKYGTRSKYSELPLFPGYVCCRFDVQSRLPILTTPGVIQVLGAGNMPMPLSDVEVNSLQTALRTQHPVVPYPFVDAGQRVRINSGALAGVEGIVISFTQRLRLRFVHNSPPAVGPAGNRSRPGERGRELRIGLKWVDRRHQAQHRSIWPKETEHWSCIDHPDVAVPPDHRTSPEDWSVAECVRILRRRKATLLWITCLGVLATVLVTSVQPRIYQSRALLEIQAFNEDFLNLRDIYPTATFSADAGLYMETQAELLQQDSLIERVARKFHLEGRPEFQPSTAFLSKLRQDIRIVPVRNSRILQIVCDSRDAPLAADLANTLARTFIEQSIETRQRAARQTYESLRVQLEGLRPALLQQDASRGTVCSGRSSRAISRHDGRESPALRRDTAKGQ